MIDQKQFSPMELKVLETLYDCYMETCPNYRGLMYDLDLPELPETHFIELKKAVQNLKKLGYVITEKGLMNDDGEVCGSGFSLNYQFKPEISQMLDDVKASLPILIVDNMRKYGGSFVKALAECIAHADSENMEKLKYTFANYFTEYHPDKWKGNNEN